MVATGLHQDPHDRVTYYWRLRDHADFLSRIRIVCRRVEPRMSRDFLVVCDSERQAAVAGDRLARAVAADGAPLFSIDNRGSDLFVELVYAGEIGPGFVFSIDGEAFTDLDRDVAFVALRTAVTTGSATSSTARHRRRPPRAANSRSPSIHARILDALVPTAPCREERRSAAQSA